eukprot:CAMPEP_0168383916 /NCGR_PEP_ID=MMETSP0228-20121227/14145_1 /TAXON_ID=133427 /ORGANISM="Protoceratium reticulatum, Strain CCCM 535 (=CCMP 1889)" /LENGTH=476 /DNA_ID=CAMNT_0008397073 /DNA_START=44 /DNA_END=1471 /DNA_ORIENTATION=+
MATQALAALLLAAAALRARAAMCLGNFDLPGYGKVALTNAGANLPGESAGNLEVDASGAIVAHMDARVYLSEQCTEGDHNNENYMALKLLGRTLKYTTDVSLAGCGCNAALYLVSMRQNYEISSCNDFYCDANKVCGVACAEVDIQEASKRAWHSTLHASFDGSGLGGGYGGGAGWNGPRDFTSQQFAPGAACIDTSLPIDVAVSFPMDPAGNLQAMEVTLTQKGKNCPLTINVAQYEHMADIQKALADGMTPVISYWKSGDMLWMDGKGADQQGPCAIDTQQCGESVKFYDFSIEPLPGSPPLGPAPVPAAPPPPLPVTVPPVVLPNPVYPISVTEPPVPTFAPTTPFLPATTAAGDRSLCSGYDESCLKTRCCRDAGFQCYEKNKWWASCKELCTPGIDPFDSIANQQPWSCKTLGERSPGVPPHDEVVLKIMSQDMPDDLEDDMEVALTVGKKMIRAKVLRVRRHVQGDSGVG